MRVLRGLRLAALGLFGAAYLWLGHRASISADPPLAGILIGLAPLSFSTVLLAWHSRSLWLQAACAAGLGLMLWHIDFLRENTAWVYFIQHAGMHAVLGVMFGRTLLGGAHDQALCSLISRFLYAGQALDARFFRYTWRVTQVWTLYFALTTLLSALLFFAGPREWWSVYANLATPAIIGALFAIEFAIRRRTLPRSLHASIAGTIRAYQDYARAQREGKGTPQ